MLLYNLKQSRYQLLYNSFNWPVFDLCISTMFQYHHMLLSAAHLIAYAQYHAHDLQVIQFIPWLWSKFITSITDSQPNHQPSQESRRDRQLLNFSTTDDCNNVEHFGWYDKGTISSQMQTLARTNTRFGLIKVLHTNICFGTAFERWKLQSRQPEPRPSACS